MEWIEFLQFLKQLGLAVAGAAAFWGLIFSSKRVVKKHNNSVIWDWVTQKMIWPLYGGLALTVIVWTILLLTGPVGAHEGISILPSSIEHGRAMLYLTPIMVGWAVIGLVGIFIHRYNEKYFNETIHYGYLVNFILAFVVISIPGIVESDSFLQAFFAGHGFHSIFTVGTVLVLDFLFVISHNKPILQQHIYPFFPTISKVIWVGLAIDFASVLLIFNKVQATLVDPRFLFMQIVVAVVIMNGVMLSGPITRKILDTVKEGGHEMAKRWQMFANIAGAISITSWLSLTFWDYFENVQLEFWHFMVIYIVLILFVHVCHCILEKITEKEFQFSD